MRIPCMRLELDNRVGALPCDDRWQSAGDGRVADVKAAGEDVVTGRGSTSWSVRPGRSLTIRSKSAF